MIFCNCSVPLTVTAKIHPKSPLAMDFSTLESLSYGQRSKCADLLNSYDIFIISYSGYFSATLLAKTLRILTLYSGFILLLYIYTFIFTSYFGFAASTAVPFIRRLPSGLLLLPVSDQKTPPAISFPAKNRKIRREAHYLTA